LIEANEGREVDVVFDMAGGETFERSYQALAHFGRIVVCGIASQEPNEVRTGSLLRHSRSVVGFYLFHCLERPMMVADALEDLFLRLARGELRVVVGGTYPLENAAQSHIDLRERRTTGKLLLDPSASRPARSNGVRWAPIRFARSSLLLRKGTLARPRRPST
jgi:NADPH2:quinone reductase